MPLWLCRVPSCPVQIEIMWEGVPSTIASHELSEEKRGRGAGQDLERLTSLLLVGYGEFPSILVGQVSPRCGGGWWLET